MRRTSRTLGRVGVATIGALAFLATPALGVISASAAPATISPVSPWNGTSGGNISDKNDGTNSTVHLEAQINQATSPDPNATSVRFSYCIDNAPNNGVCDAAPVQIATDATAPYSAEWAVPATITDGTNVEIIYEALASNGTTVIDTQTRHFIVDNSKSTVHITNPADGGNIGTWNNAAPATTAGTFIAKGTVSTDNPAVTVQSFQGNNTSSNGTANAVVDTTAHTWSAIVNGPTFTATDQQRRIEAIAGGTQSDEEIVANFYNQTLPASGFTLQPSSQSSGLVSGGVNSQDFTVQANDQNGNPIAGLNVILNTDHGTITVEPPAGPAQTAPSTGDCATAAACARTDVNGQVKFFVHLASAQTATITAQSDKNGDGSYDSSTDESRTATFTAYNAVPTTLTTTALPNQANYSPNEYTPVNVGDTIAYAAPVPPAGTDPSTATDTTSGGTPLVRTLFVDQNNHVLADTTITNFNYAVDRVLADSSTTGSIAATQCSGTTKDVVGTCKTDDFGYIYLPHNGAAAQNGSDTFRAWVEVDGFGGETAGDTKAPNLTLNFAGPQLLWEPCNPTPSNSGWCNTQAPLNTPETYTVDTSVGGVARNGDTINFTLTSGILTTQQPAGTIRDSDSTAHCVSGQGGEPAGGCKITVNDPTAETVRVTAVDTSTGRNARLNIDFRSNSLAFRQADNYDVAVVRPVAANEPQSSAYGINTDELLGARPGDVMISQYFLQDINGNRLANVAGTATLNHGYFTDIPKSYNTYATNDEDEVPSGSIPWSDVTLNGTPALGTKIGGENGQVAPKNNGTTLHFQTDNHGVVTMAVSIGRDAQFDRNGRVIISPTVTVGNQTFTLAPLNAEYDYVDNNFGHADNIGNGHVTDGPIFDDNAVINFTFSTDATAQNQEVDPSDNSIDDDWTGGGYWNAASNNPLAFVEVNHQSLTGNIPTSQTRTVAATTKDSFGNLTRSGGNAITVNTNGVGELGDTGEPGDSEPLVSSFFQDIRTLAISNDDPQEGEDPGGPGCTPINPCGTAGHQDVTATWDVHAVDYQANPGTPPPAFVPFLHQPSTNCDDPVAQKCVDAVGPVNVASLDWYIQAINTANGAHYFISHTPHGRVFVVGTTVSEKVTALDQHNQPIIGLTVTWFGAGPGQQGCNVNCGQSTTDQNGNASYSYAGSPQGNTTVTGVVTAPGSANELARVTDHVGFDGTPSIKVNHRHLSKAGRVRISGFTRPGAKVVLYSEVKGKHHFKRVASTTAASDGSYSFSRKIKKTTSFHVRVDRLVTSVNRKCRVG